MEADFRKAINEAMKIKKITPYNLEKRTGIHRSQISRFLNSEGDLAGMGAEYVQSCFRTLGIRLKLPEK